MEELKRHQKMLADDTSSSDEETGDAITDVGAEMGEISKEEDTAHQNKSPCCKKLQVSLKCISEPDKSNGIKENQNVSEDTTILSSVSRWLITNQR